MNAPETISNGLTSSTFSKIPLDVLLNILDELDLGDLFFFSQTCRTVRGLTHKDWPSAIAGNDPQQRRQRTNFWAILAYQLPRHWVCEACTKLHVIRRVQSFNHGDLRCDSNFKSADMKVPSRIMHAYVQMALKLSRPENRLVFPRQMPTLLRPNYLLGNINPSRRKAKIIDGRLLVYAESQDVSNFLHTRRQICPHSEFKFKHQWYWEVFTPRFVCSEQQMHSREQYRYVVEAAANQKGQEFRGSCCCCPTDYSACYDGRTTLVRAWYDFGAYSSPEDITWKAHVDRDHILYHEPGSIREKWEEREEVGGRDGTANPSSSAGVGKSYPCHRGDEVDDFATAIMGLGLDDEL